MDCKKIGGLILKLRKENNLTQKQLADILYLSDKTISKWERGLGCPDVSLLHHISEIFGVNVEKLLAGELKANERDNGDMKRIKFYVCPECGNIVTSTGDVELSCCDRKLNALTPQKADENHNLNVEIVDDDYYVTFSHDMTKEHYINFVACASWDRVVLVRLYPEQGGEARIPRISGGKFYFGCNKHGLWTQD